MSFFEKLKFWGHEEEPEDWMRGMDAGFPTGGGPPEVFLSPGQTTGMGSLIPSPPTGGFSPEQIQPSPASVHIVPPQPLYQQVQPPLNKDMEILSLKLDAIKNILDTMNMRLERLESHGRAEARFAEREIKF